VQKISLKRTLITDICIALIILGVYAVVFVSGSIFSGRPALKGNSSGSKVGLQIAVIPTSDVGAYISMMSDLGICATFFFDSAQRELAAKIEHAGQSVGQIEQAQSVPVMSYGQGRKVGTSIDIDRLKQRDDWQQVLSESVSAGMLLYVVADNDFDDFEKIVQIVLDKGYTIVEMEEMF